MAIAAVLAVAIAFRVAAGDLFAALGVLLYRGIRSMRSTGTANKR